MDSLTPCRLDPDTALAAFDRLVNESDLQERLAWRMLTGVPERPVALNWEQVARIERLVAIEAVLRDAGGTVGKWLAAPQTAPILSGATPADYLTDTGTEGYNALLLQLTEWSVR